MSNPLILATQIVMAITSHTNFISPEACIALSEGRLVLSTESNEDYVVTEPADLAELAGEFGADVTKWEDYIWSLNDIFGGEERF